MRRFLLPLLLLCLLAPAAGAAAQAPEGAIKYSVQTLGGAPAYGTIPRTQVRVEGTIKPAVAGESVLVRATRGGLPVSVQRVPVQDGGAFRAKVPTGAQRGTLVIEVFHEATPQQGSVLGSTTHLTIVSPRAYRGLRGPSVRLLQRELLRLGYALRRSGRYDGATARAVEAFRKLTGQARNQQASRRVFELLGRGGGAFHPRYPHQGNHFEGDLTHQVLAEVTSGGRVRRIYPMSSGKPSTPTVIGKFHVYSKTPGTNAKGMVDANYFIRGYAIHGYAEVPTHAASHGCLRIPIPDAAAVFHWAKTGYPVDVYTRSGRGSHRVKGNAGP